MERQKELIKNTDWDILVVLDACRWDFFKKVYQDYFSDESQKLESASACTSDWVKEIFGNKKFENVVYVSANPHIASDIKIDNFLGGKHFYRVIDVWDWGWDMDWGTVPPNQVSKAAIDASLEYPGKRLIIHFMQPHGPFPQLKSLDIRKSPLGKIRILIDQLGINLMGRGEFRKVKESIWRFIWPYWKKIEGQHQDTLGTEAIAKEYGVDVLRNLYNENLKLVLEEVKDLVKHLSGNIVITADHGEALGGEEGFGHRKMVVPWLELEGGLVDKDQPEKRKIVARIRNLKRESMI